MNIIFSTVFVSLAIFCNASTPPAEVSDIPQEVAGAHTFDSNLILTDSRDDKPNLFDVNREDIRREARQNNENPPMQNFNTQEYNTQRYDQGCGPHGCGPQGCGTQGCGPQGCGTQGCNPQGSCSAPGCQGDRGNPCNHHRFPPDTFDPLSR